MSELLLDGLLEACTSHGIAAERADGVVRVQDGLTLEPRVSERSSAEGTAQVQVDFVIGSPRLGARPLLDAFAGLGPTRTEAESNALRKFLEGSFHVLVESLTTHRCHSEQVDWEEWEGASGAAWRVCSGPLLIIATREGGRIDGFPEFYPVLSGRFRERMGAGCHWMRVFVGAIDGGVVGREVLVDGEPWAEGEQLLAAHEWTYPPGYASLRHLLIALPRG
jgi:hypothetical protein